MRETVGRVPVRRLRVGPSRARPATWGEAVHLEPQAFDLLVHLIDHRDRTVSKVELLDAVWGHRFVSEASLTTRVKEVRQALGDDGRQQHTIKNERGRGYRFVAPVDPGPSHRPDSSTAVVGRAGDLAALASSLRESRLVTLTGPGGVGKSTLARVLAASADGEHAHGAHVVELAPLNGDVDVLPTIARALDVSLDSARPDDTVRTLAALDAFVVLDNCEHVVDAASTLVDGLLRLPGSRLRVVATSQVPLGVSGESIVEIKALDLEDARDLFVRRARAA